MRSKKYILLFLLIGALSAQNDLRFDFGADSLEVNVGETKEIEIKLLNDKNKLVDNPFYVYGQRKNLSVLPRISESGGKVKVTVKAHNPGRLLLTTQTVTVKRDDRVRGSLVINVPYPPIEKVAFSQTPSKLYTNTTTNLSAKVTDQAGLDRTAGTLVAYKSSDESIASFDELNNLITKKAGRITVSATAEGVSQSLKIKVVKNPARSVSISTNGVDEIRTGDVLRVSAKAVSGSRSFDDVPVYYSFTGKAEYGEFGLPASAQITSDGRFVAETAGMYTVSASAGGYSAQKTIKVVPRNVNRKVKLVGHGLITNVLTSDLWVWPGIGKHKGKDFAVTGTWGSNGEAYFWDVTDPANMVIIDTVTVDARTVNDVKISEDGRVGVITREGASDRKNGFVILDVSDPYNVTISAAYNDDMTGGVHNAFIYENHVYAVNNGRKYDIINIDDPKKPFRVGVYELDTPGHSIHDVWIEDGIAYSSNWADGIVAVDIGAKKHKESDRSKSQFNPLLAKAGQGSPSNPVKLAEMKDPTGRNHAAFPYLNEETGQFYIIGGDENFPWGVQATKNKPSNPRGGYHFMNFTDPNNPREDAIYEVPEAGSHNLWIYGDILLAGNYQGGLRIVDISGELLGDIYKQGREIAHYLSYHKDGRIPNAPMVWGAQPYKDYIFFSDMNSGLYCVAYEDEQKTASAE
ncbi:MAG: hypothetical protein VXX68_00080 [Candidatus Neomarinimicrobiota bacterium]|nr:hypothetical protein [Candidatus Neomarinimicrobiota bacterium]